MLYYYLNINVLYIFKNFFIEILFKKIFVEKERQKNIYKIKIKEEREMNNIFIFYFSLIFFHNTVGIIECDSFTY